MAHPIADAEEAMKTFIAQWFRGLMPSLQLSTKPDGTISVKSQVLTFPTLSSHATWTANDAIFRCRRSGYFSRLRRRKERSELMLKTNGPGCMDLKDSQQPTLTDIIGPDILVHDSNVVQSSFKPNLIVEKLAPIDIAPIKPNLTVEKLAPTDIGPSPSCPPKLTIEAQSVISISPRTVHHPAIINACYSIIGKHPSQMTASEEEKFQLFKQFKRNNGQPIEEDVVFLPIGGLRTCLNCDNLT